MGKLTPSARGGVEAWIPHDGDTSLSRWIAPTAAPWNDSLPWFFRTPGRLGCCLYGIGAISVAYWWQQRCAKSHYWWMSLFCGLAGLACRSRVCLSRWQLQALFDRLESH